MSARPPAELLESVRLGITKRTVWLVVLVAVAAAGCGTAAPSGGEPAGRLDVVATTTVLADLVRQVGGDRIAVSSIVPPGAEAHTFDPTPRDAARIASADLIVANGLGLDDWLAELASDAGADAPIVRLGEGLSPDAYIASGASGDGPPNPHLWLDPNLALAYVERIRDALVAADPAGAATYATAAATASDRLAALDQWARSRFATVPDGSRRLVAFHDALPYLARAFGLEIVGLVVEAPGQDPSAGEVADLVDEIRRTGVSVIVSEAQFSDDVVRTIAEETDAKVVADLYTDSLGEHPVDSYDGMIRWDVDRLVEAMGGGS